MAQRTGPVNVTEDIDSLQLASAISDTEMLREGLESTCDVSAHLEEYDDDDLTLLNVPQEAVGFVTGRYSTYFFPSRCSLDVPVVLGDRYFFLLSWTTVDTCRHSFYF